MGRTWAGWTWELCLQLVCYVQECQAMLCGSTLQIVKVCGKSTRGRKNVFQRTEWSTSQIIFLVRREDKEECWPVLLWDRKMVKYRMDWDLKKWEFISWFCHETSHVTSGKALDALAHLTHVCEMGIISSMVKKDFMRRTSSMVWVLKHRGRAVSEGVLWFLSIMGTAELD